MSGTSGGPVLNSKGELVGILYGRHMNRREAGPRNWFNRSKDPVYSYTDRYGYPQERSWFIPVSKLKKFLIEKPLSIKLWPKQEPSAMKSKK